MRRLPLLAVVSIALLVVVDLCVDVAQVVAGVETMNLHKNARLMAQDRDLRVQRIRQNGWG